MYVGVTSNLEQRMVQHTTKTCDGFSAKYNLSTLIYFETTNDTTSAITREKCLKKWKRSWKIRLIEKYNPKWNDLMKL